MDNLYLAKKTPVLVGDMLVNFGDILPETSKSSACWDIGGNSHLTSQAAFPNRPQSLHGSDLSGTPTI